MSPEEPKLVAAGKWDKVKAILFQLARFEQDGTLPNMIRGNDAGNRDTSDAPLWFFTVCADLMAATGRSDFLKTDCNGRSLKKVLADRPVKTPLEVRHGDRLLNAPNAPTGEHIPVIVKCSGYGSS